MKLPYITSILLIYAAIGCKKSSAPGPVDSRVKAPLAIQFDNVLGDKNLQLNTGSYTNAAGENFSVSLCQYFISNIQLKAADGSKYIVPQDSSYFLVRESDPATQFLHVKVPVGDYTGLTFTVGVDSLRNTMDVSQRTGVLDPSAGMDDGMYWGWNSGYIFFKLEGLSSAAPVDPTGQNKFRYHIGGFGGFQAPTLNNIKIITLDLTAGGLPHVQQGRESNIHIMVDILKMFNGSTTLSIAENPTVMFSDYSVHIADNYVKMFRHDHTEN